MTAPDRPAPRTVRAAAFPALDWLHTDGRAVTLEDLRGRIAVLEFMTFG